MRQLILAASLILHTALHACIAAAFEVEDSRVFGAGSGPEISVLSTTDTDFVAPLIAAFLLERPELRLRYVVASSQEVYRAIHDEGAAFDLVISSAMDLQMKLANDGFAAGYASGAVAGLPDWARWQDRLFGFALEPVVLLASRRAMAGLEMPRTRRDLIDLLRADPGRFNGKIATYDPHVSGAGYLFATQDARQTDAFWRLAEVMGRLNARLYCCSGDMIDDLAAGRVALAYNVVGSYAMTRLPQAPDIEVIEPEDFTLALLRTAFIPVVAKQPDLGGALLDFMLGVRGRALIDGVAGLPPMDKAALKPHLRPIRLDPGLLVYLDRIKRQNFLAEWDAAMVQP
ncbi:ABC transporter substrate-binding protein [Pseudorhodobacter sp.]|uniref:ABC transporter substrate-binding protein n=1 Tax=Pseudorhodobacter sp. TaxID=1934400 RepID=UPI00264A341A|nr:ABC transporter substrate-binding protein [Pseudorhodobacter sp.]MDN5788044.1 ABC transporter substrate-binding protein [Pseudorhodobacter sp.]